MIPGLQPLVEVFKNNNRYEAHAKAATLLRDLAYNKDFLFPVMKENLRNPKFLSRPMHHPIIAVPIFENEDFSFIAHLWFPLPTKEVDITHQTIHHHGKLLLTSVAPLGPGYESILFKKGFEINFETGETQMQIDRIYQNSQYNLEFIDSYTPHVVFFPNEFSITLALWSSCEKQKTDKLRHSRWLQTFKTPLIAAIKQLGLTRYFGLNSPEYYDFFPSHGKLLALKERNFGYQPGSNAGFIQNVCHALSKLEFNDDGFLNELKVKFTEMNHTVGLRCVEQLLKHEMVPGDFVSHQMNIPQVNVKKSEILKVFPSSQPHSSEVSQTSPNSNILNSQTLV